MVQKYENRSAGVVACPRLDSLFLFDCSPLPPWTPLSSLSPAGAPQARVPSIAVPRGGADPDGLHDVGRLEVWAGQRARLQKAPHWTALDCGLDSRCCWPFNLDPWPDPWPEPCYLHSQSLWLPVCISSLDLLTLHRTDLVSSQIFLNYIKMSCHQRRGTSWSSVSFTFMLLQRLQN